MTLDKDRICYQVAFLVAALAYLESTTSISQDLLLGTYRDPTGWILRLLGSAFPGGHRSF